MYKSYDEVLSDSAATISKAAITAAVEVGWITKSQAFNYENGRFNLFIDKFKLWDRREVNRSIIEAYKSNAKGSEEFCQLLHLDSYARQIYQEMSGAFEVNELPVQTLYEGEEEEYAIAKAA